MNDYSDEIVELNNRIYHEVTEYIKEKGSVKLCENITVTDGENIYLVSELNYDGQEIWCQTQFGVVYLAELMNFCIFDIYTEILDCCIKNS